MTVPAVFYPIYECSYFRNESRQAMSMSAFQRLPCWLVYSVRRSLNYDSLCLPRRTATVRQGSRASLSTRSTYSSFNAPVGGLGCNFRVSTVFTALLVLGTGATAFGLCVVFLYCLLDCLSESCYHLIAVINSTRPSHYGRRNYAVICVLASKPEIRVISV